MMSRHFTPLENFGILPEQDYVNTFVANSVVLCFSQRADDSR